MTRFVGEWLTEWAVSRPQEIAVTDATTTWTYGQLPSVTARAAGALRSTGIGPGSRVALLASDTAATVAVIHAVRHTGAVLVPLNRRAALPELRAQLRVVPVHLLLHDEEHAEVAAAAVDATSGVTALQSAASILDGATADADVPHERVDLQAPATIMYTSGTTGRAKAAALTHGNHAASADAWAERLEPRPTDRWLSCLPLFHVGGLAMVIRASRWGVPLEVHTMFDAAAVGDAIDRGVSHLSLVAVMLERLLDARGDRRVPATLRAVLLGGGPVPPALLRRVIDRGLPVIATYGMTETASGVVADGRPLTRVELRIGEPDRDGVGEVQVRGPMVFAGYEGDPTASAAVLDGGWLHTADLGWLDRDGTLMISDRRDDLIISGGENVSPAEVEAVLLGHPAVIDAGVVGRPDRRWGSVPIAVVVIRAGDAVTDEELARHCRERLAGYKVPRAFRRVAALPRSAGGKLLHRELTIAQLGPEASPVSLSQARPSRTRR